MDIFWNNTFKINEFDHIKLKIKNCDPIPQFMYIHLWLGICIFNEAWNAYFHNFPCVQRLQNVLLKDPSTYCFWCYRKFWYKLHRWWSKILLLYYKLCSWKYLLIHSYSFTDCDFIHLDMLRIKYNIARLLDIN